MSAHLHRSGAAPRAPLRLPAARLPQVYDWIRGSPSGVMGLALVVGAGAGVGAIVFRYLILWFTQILSGHDDYSGTAGIAHPFFSGAANPHLVWLGRAVVLVTPMLGGLLYGPLIDRFAREARGHGVPEVMLAVAERGGRIKPAVALVKSLASALCIGSGGSVGREGPIVQIGSALGSTFGQVLRLPESRLRLLVACGAAGGISATFNAPIAGVFFGLELILRDFETESFGAVVLASVTAAIIGRAAFGAQAFLVLPAFHLVSYWECLLYAGLGVLAAVVGVGFTRVLYAIEDLADRIWHGPEWARPAAGGLMLGLLLLALPQLYGVGYPVLEHGIRGDYAVWFLLVLMVAKRRGIDILRGRAANLMAVLTVADAMRPLPAAVPQELPLGELIERFTQSDAEALPVIDAQGAYRGMVTVREVEEAVRDNALDAAAGDLAQRLPVLAPDQTLERTLGLLVREERAGLPVVAAGTGGIAGWVTHRDVLRAYNARLERSLSAAEQHGLAGAACRTQRAPAYPERASRHHVLAGPPARLSVG